MILSEYIKSLKIGDKTLKNNVFLAPLAGVTDVAFRTLAKEYGAGLTYTEMVSAKGLIYDSQKTYELLATAGCEDVTAVQIFGCDRDIMAEAVTKDELKKFDFIDINMGCPVQKIVSNGEGSALMLDLDKASGIISACAKCAKRPITVKFRSGFNEHNINAVEFAHMAEDSGAELITVHARTKSQMYGGSADLRVIESVKNAVKIPVIGNGDIVDRASALRMFETGVDGIMVARGCMGRPWIFAEILGGKQSEVNLKSVILRHIALISEYFSERYVVVNMRKHIAWYLKGYYGGVKIKNHINTLTSLDEVIAVIEREL